MSEPTDSSLTSYQKLLKCIRVLENVSKAGNNEVKCYGVICFDLAEVDETLKEVR